jgi:hypothetical protein
MDIYSTSFSHPRQTTPRPRSPLSSLDSSYHIHSHFGPNYASRYQPSNAPDNPTSNSGDVPLENIQKVALDAMQAQPCHITYTRAEHGKAWNFHLSGNYLQVITSRAAIIRECPVQVSSSSATICFYLISSFPLRFLIYKKDSNDHQGPAYRYTGHPGFYTHSETRGPRQAGRNSGSGPRKHISNKPARVWIILSSKWCSWPRSRWFRNRKIL